MAVRAFESPDGIAWTAWEVIPGQVSEFRSSFGSHLPRQMAEGWLCFDCGSEKRRLYPLPPHWEERTEAELWFLCRAAEPVRTRKSIVFDVALKSCDPAPGIGAPEGRESAPAIGAVAMEAEAAGV